LARHRVIFTSEAFGLGPNLSKEEATMRHSLRVWSWSLWTLAAVAGAWATLGGGPAEHVAFAKSKKAEAPAAAPAPAKDVNACGCYKDTAGACFCGKKGKCDCPGDCEPKGCEEKRQKELEKETAAEEKKAAEADKKQRASAPDDDDRPAKAPKHKTDGTGQ
jgi:hypothetical protein